jgi:pimeloyl-ACP methyl ester carboxylesterase
MPGDEAVTGSRGPVLFCHGAGVEPRGPSGAALVAAGYDVIAPDYRGLDLATATEIITYQILDQEHPPLMVGYSFGGAVALLAAIQAARAGHTTAGLVLCAPALFLAETVVGPERLRVPAPAILIHGTMDEAVPVALSRGFAREHDVRLREVDDDHTLSRSLGVILETIAALHG